MEGIGRCRAIRNAARIDGAAHDTGQSRWALMQPSRDGRPPPLGRLPLRRTDRVEDAAAWLLAAIALFVLLLAIWGGAGVYADALDQSRHEHGQRTQVDAVLLEDPQRGYREADSQDVAWRSVQFVDTSGSEHVADVPLAAVQPAGDTVRLWVDRNDRVVPAPLTQTDAVVIGAMAGLGITALGVAVLASLWCGLRRLLDIRNSVAWDREWAQVEPVWSGRDHRS